ncbi:hypothetical protein [endosymbiont GvMRE of Glomus versiforme]|uniref:hypothetical protein n=1 Tax=endosymbiont GvMRE of Glomus versiforme TaxID=2039283 RepID=UPI00155924CC|nr:hypothetical protein [endosymbiont GvMRE of Glomus versiforme]
MVGKVYYLKNEFERAVGEREDLRKNRDYWQAEEHKERVKADQLEAKIYQEDDCKII